MHVLTCTVPFAGYLNQAELSSLIEHFILIDPYRENLHNQLMCGIYANVYRDTPDAGVASWVSANDKPSNAPKPPTGDAADQRLKHEIKQLLPRMRHRIKTLKDVSDYCGRAGDVVLADMILIPI